jgi:hypothetical protein
MALNSGLLVWIVFISCRFFRQKNFSQKQPNDKIRFIKTALQILRKRIFKIYTPVNCPKSLRSNIFAQNCNKDLVLIQNLKLASYGSPINFKNKSCYDVILKIGTIH